MRRALWHRPCRFEVANMDFFFFSVSTEILWSEWPSKFMCSGLRAVLKGGNWGKIIMPWGVHPYGRREVGSAFLPLFPLPHESRVPCMHKILKQRADLHWALALLASWPQAASSKPWQRNFRCLEITQSRGFCYCSINSPKASTQRFNSCRCWKFSKHKLWKYTFPS